MISYVSVLFDMLRGRIAAVREGDLDRGASALEWAIIAAIAVVIATVIGTIVYNVVQTKGGQLQKCADQPVGGSCQ